MDENREIRAEIAEMLETELRDPDFLEEADLDEERIERLLSSDALRQIAGELAEQEERSQEAYCGTPEQGRFLMEEVAETARKYLDCLEDEPEEVDEQTLEMIYNFYAKELCNRFGTERVMERYHYTRDIPTITATRMVKINFCEMLMEELPGLSRWFGIELSRMTYNGFNYDAENDFHGIYFLYGSVGLTMMIAFLAYFVYLIIRALLRDFKRVFTLEAGAFGMAFLLAIVYAYHTAGLLRRPNASFYLSVILAYIYYLVQLRRNEAVQ